MKRKILLKTILMTGIIFVTFFSYSLNAFATTLVDGSIMNVIYGSHDHKYTTNVITAPTCTEKGMVKYVIRC